MNLNEHEINAELNLIKIITNLRKNNSRKEEIEKIISNTKKIDQQKIEFLKSNSAKEFSKILQTVIARQNATVTDYEKERLSVIVENTISSTLFQFRTQISFFTLKKDIRETYLEKRKNSEINLENVQNELFELKIIEAEYYQEIQNLQIIYSSFQNNYLIFSHFLRDMIYGINPSFSYTKEIAFHGFTEVTEYSLASITIEFLNKKFTRKLLDMNSHKLFEKNRLLMYGRPETDLKNIYTEIGERFNSDIKFLQSCYYEDKESTNSLYLSLYTECNNNQIVYEMENSKISDTISNNINEITSKYEDEKSLILQENCNEKNSKVFLTSNNFVLSSMQLLHLYQFYFSVKCLIFFFSTGIPLSELVFTHANSHTLIVCVPYM